MHISSLNLKAFLSLSLFFLQCQCISAQGLFTNFNNFFHLNTQVGLSNDFVNQCTKDKSGFLWIATQNGLNRYDGHNIKQFFHNQSDSQSICGNHVSALLADSKNRLWIGTNASGISILDLKTFKYKHLLPSAKAAGALRPYEVITSIYEDNQKRIWITTWGSGLYLYNEETHTLKQFAHDDKNPKSIYINKVKYITQDKTGQYWVGIWAEGSGKNAGLVAFNPQAETFTGFGEFITPAEKAALPEKVFGVLKFVHSIYPDKDNNLWIAGYTGMACVHLSNHTAEVYDNDQTDLYGKLSAKTVRFITRDARQNLLIATGDGGLNMWQSDGKMQYFTFSPSHEGSISNNEIKHIYTDADEVLFISTLGGGVNISLQAMQEFQFIPTNQIYPENTQALTQINAVKSATPQTWLFSGNVPVKLWNSNSGNISNPSMDGLQNFTARRIFKIDNLQYAWVSENGKLCFYNAAAQQLSISPVSHPLIEKSEHDLIRGIIRWNGDTLLLVHNYRGLVGFDKKNNHFFDLEFPKEMLGFYNCVYKINNAEVMLGYQNGIFIYNLYTAKIKHVLFKTFPKERLLKCAYHAIHRDNTGRLWASNDSGLALLKYPQTGYTQYTFNKHQQVAGIMRICEDEKGNFWLNSDYFILHFNTQTFQFTEIKNAAIKTNHICNYQADFDPSSGIYIAGCDGGIFVVNTRIFYSDFPLKKIALGDIQFRNVSNPLNESITFLQDLNLSYNQNSFSISISNFDYAKNKYYKIVYKLEGQDNHWHEVPANYKIDIINLEPGDYTLLVKYENLPDNHITQASISIHIASPYYNTWWFISLCILALGGMVWWYIKRKTRILKEQNTLLENRVHERTKDLELEKQKSDELLLNILPLEIAEELKSKGNAEARNHESVTVLFTDFVNFTGISENMKPTELVSEIDSCFKAFDRIIEKNGIEKIKTIGDAYLAVGGIPNADPDHALNTVKAAVEIMQYMKENPMFKIRIGIHSGPVVAGIVGIKKYAYDIWGDTVNVASRMESNGAPMEINISEATYQLVKGQYKCTYRGKISVKNRGELDMYFVQGMAYRE